MCNINDSKRCVDGLETWGIMDFGFWIEMRRTINMRGERGNKQEGERQPRVSLDQCDGRVVEHATILFLSAAHFVQLPLRPPTFTPQTIFDVRVQFLEANPLTVRSLTI